ncbi:MAG: ATP-binding protein [Anaerolineae bacterium]
MRRSEARFRALFNQNYQFVGLLRPDGTVIEINDSALSYAGVEAADVVGQPFWETLWWAYDPAEREKLKGAIRQAAQGRTITYQTHAAGAGGRTLPIDFTLKPVIDADGSVIMLIPEGHDRSGEATVEALTHFIEDSAHHLRSPLTVIKTSLYLGAAANQLADEAVVRARDALPADACEQVRPELEQAAGHISQVNRRLMHIQQAADNLHSLIESTLSLSHLDQDTPVHATVDLRALVHKETTQFTPVAAERRIQLDVHVPDEPVLVAGQADQLRLVVQNLVENAVRYTPEAGRIGVSLTTVDHTAMLRVWDSGICIPQEDLTRIFTRFYRSQNGKDFTQRGTGLGLAFVKKTVELHKGRIEVESKVGEGSAFTITLPVVSPPRTG